MGARVSVRVTVRSLAPTAAAMTACAVRMPGSGEGEGAGEDTWLG